VVRRVSHTWRDMPANPVRARSAAGSGELAVADGQGHEHQKPLSVLGHVAHYVGQEFEGVACSARGLGYGWRGLAIAEHCRVDEEVRDKGVACWWKRHGWPGLQPMASSKDAACRGPWNLSDRQPIVWKSVPGACVD
jgi:hypothetical protein